MNDPFPDLNLMDWSPNHLMALALVLGTDLDIWNAETNSTELLLSLNYDLVCSVGWTQHGNYLTVGTNTGVTQVCFVTGSDFTPEFSILWLEINY
jgi:cell division cycle 20-like protein 1 (cofactor of APC complex)